MLIKYTESISFEIPKERVTEDIIPEYPIHFDHEEKMYKVGTIEKHTDMTDKEWEEYSYYILAPKAKVFYYLDD